MAQTKLILFVCDHPSCTSSVEGRNQNAPGQTVPVSGYHGILKFSSTEQFGDRVERWFACRKTHVSGAIKTMLEKISNG